MAHGGLAQAGKVKATTPKVEPQEKKKVLQGRAGKRKQYNQRVLNAKRAPDGTIIPVQPNKQKK